MQYTMRCLDGIPFCGELHVGVAVRRKGRGGHCCACIDQEGLRELSGGGGIHTWEIIDGVKVEVGYNMNGNVVWSMFEATADRGNFRDMDETALAGYVDHIARQLRRQA